MKLSSVGCESLVTLPLLRHSCFVAYVSVLSMEAPRDPSVMLVNFRLILLRSNYVTRTLASLDVHGQFFSSLYSNSFFACLSINMRKPKLKVENCSSKFIRILRGPDENVLS